MKAFSRALESEAHVLTRQPDLLWQQMYNRQPWEEEERKLVPFPELVHRGQHYLIIVR